MSSFSIAETSNRNLLLGGIGATVFALLMMSYLHFALVVVVFLALAVGLVAPLWALYFYAATLFLFQVPILGNAPIAVPTITGGFFLFSAAAYLVRKRRTKLDSSITCTTTLFCLAALVAAVMTPAWFVSHPRGFVTLVSLAVSGVAVALILREGRGLKVLGLIFGLGSALIATLTVYETVTGQFNKFGLFDSYDDRAYGLADPNYTAAMLVTFLPFLVAQLAMTNKPWHKAVTVPLVLLPVIGVAMTASRGGILGLVVVMLCIFLWFRAPRALTAQEMRRPSWMSLATIPVLLLCVATAAKLAPDTLYDRLSDPSSWTDPHKESRLRIWDFYLDKWLQSPLWGFGPGFLDETFLEGRELTAHNTYLEFLLEIGFGGAIIYAFINVLAIREALLARRLFITLGEPQLALLSAATGAAIVGFNVTSMFLTLGTHKEIWLLFGLAAAVRDIAKVKRGQYIVST